MKIRFLILATAAVALVGLCYADRESKNSTAIGLGGLFCIGMINQRTLRDKNLSVTAALPAANASNFTAAIDTAEVNPGRVPDVEFLIELPATPSLVDAKTITITLQDSADGVTFAAVADVPAQVLTGAGGVGAAALAYQAKLPFAARRYLRLQQAVLAAGGDNTAISGSLGLIF